MADKKITQLNPLVSADAAIADVVAVADISANEIKEDNGLRFNDCRCQVDA